MGTIASVPDKAAKPPTDRNAKNEALRKAKEAKVSQARPPAKT